jgi:hypothetical protein
MQEDPLKTVNLAGDSQYRQVLLDHRTKLATFAQTHGDQLVPGLLRNEVAPGLFVKE